MAGVSQPSPLTPAWQRAQALADSGDLAGARAVLERAVELGKVNLSEDDPDVLRTAYLLGTVLQRADDPVAARRVLEEAYAAGLWRLGDSDALMLEISHDIGVVAEELGNRHEARKAFVRVAELGPAALGGGHWAVARARAYLGQDPQAGVRGSQTEPPLSSDPSVAPWQPRFTSSGPENVPQSAPSEEPTTAFRLNPDPNPSQAAHGTNDPTTTFPVINPTVPAPRDPRELGPGERDPRDLGPGERGAAASPAERGTGAGTAERGTGTGPGEGGAIGREVGEAGEGDWRGGDAGLGQSGNTNSGAWESDTSAGPGESADYSETRATNWESSGTGGRAGLNNGTIQPPDAENAQIWVGPHDQAPHDTRAIRPVEETTALAPWNESAPYPVPQQRYEVQPAIIYPDAPGPGWGHNGPPPPYTTEPVGASLSYQKRGLGIFAAIAAVLAAVIAVAALVFVLANRSGDGGDNEDVPTLGGSPPTGVVLKDSGARIVVSWQDPTQGTVSFLVAMGHPGEQLKPVTTLGPGQTSYEISALNPTLNYCFAVVAVYRNNKFATSQQACTNR
ncbi:tetratricopeptide repeat protein [Paractinoplanes toevensis]|uniref:Fibronectin type-III domain-containing protein n=1 Tax=Paractinoplanes toevensis TaxID=571911 RepID=A0A919TF04_9ACTN|nr:tetratricopeptide repeat protein [Actinoplanes toevensis]GIM93190.1 hypothetical protein Ato02nite_049830 [Actinoplanes toevensis]